MRIAIIGHGNVATSLHEAFAAKGMQVPMLSAHTLLTSPEEEPVSDSTDVLIYAVCDTVLPEVIRAVRVPQRVLHVHTSGTVPLSVYGQDKPHCGVMYPFQSFSKAAPIADFTDVPIFIEARGIDDISAMYTLSLALSPRVFEASQAERERLHVAGVFANNFTNCMYRIAADVLAGTSIPFSALLPLIDRTAAKVHNLAPRDAQTGPAVRHDAEVMTHHLDILRALQSGPNKALSTPIPAALYEMLSAYIADNTK